MLISLAQTPPISVDYCSARAYKTKHSLTRITHMEPVLFDLDPADDSVLWSIKKTCQRLGVCRVTVWKKLKDGDLTGIHVNGRHMVLAQSVRDLIRRQIAEAQQKNNRLRPGSL